MVSARLLLYDSLGWNRCQRPVVTPFRFKSKSKGRAEGPAGVGPISAPADRSQGIGAGFIPEIYESDMVDEIIAVSEEDSRIINHKVCRIEGIPIGISSGSIVWAAMEVAKRPENKGKLIVAVIPSCAERYLSTWIYEDINAESDPVPEGTAT